MVGLHIYPYWIPPPKGGDEILEMAFSLGGGRQWTFQNLGGGHFFPWKFSSIRKYALPLYYNL
jgi:hypothetical protein